MRSIPLLRRVLWTLLVFITGHALAAAPQDGWWWNPAESGSGYAIERQGDSLFMAAFLYEAGGAATWYAASLALQPDGTYKGDMTRFVGGKSLLGAYKAPASNSIVAKATASFPFPYMGTLSIAFPDNTPARVIPINRFAFSSPVFDPSQAAFQNGWWWNEQESGTGYFIEVQGSQAFIASFMYDTSGQPTWYASVANLFTTSSLSGPLDLFANGQSLSGNYKAPSVSAGAAGTMAYGFSSNAIGFMTLPNKKNVNIKRFVFDPVVSSNHAPVPFAGMDQTVTVGDTVTLNGSASDADADNLTYSWHFLQAPKNSNTVLTGIKKLNPTFTADVAGKYRFELITDDGKVSAGQSVVTVTANPAKVANIAPVANAGSNQTVALGTNVKLSGAASSDANGDALTYAWFFVTKPAASNAALTNSTSVSSSFIGDSAGNYVVGLNVNDGKITSPQATVSITVLPNLQSIAVDCSGASCSSTNSSAYAGTGIGVWKYVNSSSQDSKIDVNISGVGSGKSVTLLFSNGSSSKSKTAPSSGTLANVNPSPSRPVATLPSEKNLAFQAHHGLRQAHFEAHNAQLQRNRAASIRLLSSAKHSLLFKPSPSPVAAPALGSSKTWVDTYDSNNPVKYNSTLMSRCAIGLGRSVNIWADKTAIASKKINTTLVDKIVQIYCGPNGGAARLTALLGDFWGPSPYATTIQDAPLSDVNISIIDVPASTGWAGYFSGDNTFLKSDSPDSNQALVFFINATTLSTNLNYTLSTLIHESTHMINYYQQSIKNEGNTGYDTWLEESSANASEDIISPSVIKNTDGTDYNGIATGDIPGYLGTGGGVDYIDWVDLSSNNYFIASSFMAYLNRKYGLVIYKSIINCTLPSYDCLDTLIKANGGTGFSDDFAHMGASIFSLMPATNTPKNYGFPAKSDGGYNLLPIDLKIYASYRPKTAKKLVSGFTPTTQTYTVDNTAANKTNYNRTGVLVPANTTLIVTVQ